MKNKIKKIIEIVALIAIVLIICSISYDNPFAKIGTHVDAKVFRYIATRMNFGEWPYKNWFDHKGPILYIINWIGLAINFGKINGLWLMQILSILITVIFTQKILKKVYKINTIWSCILNFLININVIFFIECGNMVETYILPLITGALYYILAMNSSNLKKYNLILGVLLALVGFLKVNTIVIWLTYYFLAFITCIKQKKLKTFFNIIWYSFLGALSVTVIVGAGLLITGSFVDFINDYIIFNFKYSDTNKSPILEVIKYFISESNGTIYCLIIISFILSIKNKEKATCFAILYFIATTIIIILPRRYFLHYAIISIPVYIIPIATIYNYFNNFEFKEKYKKIYKYVYLIAIIAVLILIPINQYKKQFKKVNITVPDNSKEDEIVDYIIKNTNEKDTILLIGNNCNLYLKTNRKAASKYMFQYPIYKTDNTILEKTIQDIKKNKPKYIFFTESISYLELKGKIFEGVGYNLTKVKENSKGQLFEYKE